MRAATCTKHARERQGRDVAGKRRIMRSAAVRRGAPAGDSRRTRNSAEATEQILLDAAKRVFADKGYIRATVQDIIESTGLSRGTFYLYFRSTDDIFVRTITKVVDDIVASSRVRSGHTLRQRVYDNNLRYFEIFGANRGLLRAFFEASYVDPEIGRKRAEMRSAYIIRVRDHLERQRQLGRCLPIDPDAAALSLAMMVEGTAQSFAVLKMEPFEQPLELKKLCLAVTEIWCRAVYTDPDRPLTPTAAKAPAVAAGGKRRKQPAMSARDR
ncbi:TetR/AcrR family transcriptional regulator [Bradyrhizobium sp. 1(2017)]|uniref:TetR/AcrR family transcriptional regulator n=1 Tax=Bradyrhizobium sp. 1(2017) TaxID=1404888 RepID=UPI00140EB175|nr:TetR/AcrR family transcriptional regulator [Bradyrhizobium sp. 1(2017)]QIO31788.1 TetR/AcrR family transcriptional regulator [Bradyrhizobium sp. 1(2017)]